jgi:hypothetical protein
VLLSKLFETLLKQSSSKTRLSGAAIIGLIPAYNRSILLLRLNEDSSHIRLWSGRQSNMAAKKKRFLKILPNTILADEKVGS